MDKISIVVLIVFLAIGSVHCATTISLCTQTPHPQLCATKISLCTQAPYPQLCNALVVTKPLATTYEPRFQLREAALQNALNKAEQAHRLVAAMDVSSFDERARSAWADCRELYEDAVNQLNRSLGSTNQLSAQTWLSAAITDHQTCRNGFIDFNLSSQLNSFPDILNGFSKLLSNSLAINKAISPSMAALSGKKAKNRHLLSNGFPEWVSFPDRKLLNQLSAEPPTADVVVAQDGSGNYKTISEALAASKSGSKRFVIHVKAGVYHEIVVIKRSMNNLMMVGDGIGATIVTGSRNVVDGSTTFRSATFAVSGDGFIAQGMTFVNSAGPQKHQAVALRCSSDRSVFYSCSFVGYQDTLYVDTQRQFYRDCDIYGTIDFVFGDAVVILQNCNFYVRKPLGNQQNTVTAQGRTDPNQNTGIIVHDSRVVAASDLKPVQGSFRTYLGRPWQKYSRTVFMKSFLDSLIAPAGWSPWAGNFALSTLYYGEYMNTGPGASTGGRVNWPGYHIITSATEVGKFSVGDFLAGNSWIPATGVPFTPGV